MRQADMVVGEEYAYSRYKGGHPEKVRLLGRKVPLGAWHGAGVGVEIQKEDGTVTVVPSIHMREPWAEYFVRNQAAIARREQQAQERAAAMARQDIAVERLALYGVTVTPNRYGYPLAALTLSLDEAEALVARLAEVAA